MICQVCGKEITGLLKKAHYYQGPIDSFLCEKHCERLEGHPAVFFARVEVVGRGALVVKNDRVVVASSLYPRDGYSYDSNALW